ncbi:MAG: ABC transporter ATP-binding protein, partial [Spirochaetaceae bacterium]|nr:ABC transporter ATP-binding protein [Spirochaetaceae bacterium]
MLELRGIAKVWPRLTVRAELTLGEVETVSILGPSGCGKSTLLRIVAGLERPDEGRVLLDGADLTAVSPERRGIGMVFQDFALFPHMSAQANIEYGPRIRGRPRAVRERLARALAASLGIEALLDRSPSTLSGGEQQRVALARTLAASPRIVLLDEPLSSLDYGLRRRLRSEIAARVREAGAASLHVTHDVEEAFAVADRVVLMREGSIVSQGSPEELYSAPRDAWTASFLGLGPVIPVSRIVRESEGGPFIALTPLGSFAFDGLPPAAGTD